jgi:AhpD family alkylhydroperoxidase
MAERLNYRAISPKPYHAIRHLSDCVKECGLEAALIDLVWLRISQINGCAYCVDLHYRETRSQGVSARKLNSVIVWEDSGFFTARERAAMAWAESLTLVAVNHAPNNVYNVARGEFKEKEIVDLTHAIAVMNALNRLGVGFRLQPDPAIQEHGA